MKHVALVPCLILLLAGATIADDELDAKRSARGVTPPPKGRKAAKLDHDKPDLYAKIPKSAGDAKRIKKLAADLKAKDPEVTLRRISAFIDDRVPQVPEQGWDPDHKDFDRLLIGFDHIGCASHALLFANLARACGIPTIYVKSNRHTWIRKFVATGERGGFSGHVFLEVHLDGEWKLLDAQGLEIWDDYDPADPELPGGLLAYEKGWDHFAMVHSTQRDRYIEESLARWNGFDVKKLRKNETPGRSLRPVVYAITLGKEWSALGKRVKLARAVDRYHWEQEYREKAKGEILIVTAIGGKTDLPPEDVKDWLPVSLEKLAAEAKAGKADVHSGRVANGTRVLVLSAPGSHELRELIWSVDLARLVYDLAE